MCKVCCLQGVNEMHFSYGTLFTDVPIWGRNRWKPTQGIKKKPSTFLEASLGWQAIESLPLAKYDTFDIYDSCFKSFERGCVTVDISHILCCRQSPTEVLTILNPRTINYSLSITANADLYFSIPLGHTVKNHVNFSCCVLFFSGMYMNNTVWYWRLGKALQYWVHISSVNIFTFS